jgi:hypothetical protein
MKAKTKSPIKSKTLRNPGQSLEQQRNELIYDKIMGYFLYAAFALILCGMEWSRWYFKTPPSPRIYSFLAIVAVLLFVFQFRKFLKVAKALNQGIEGERPVGQSLERLREQGAKVFHDIPGEGFNLDHVVIHSTGIYMVETKTYSKPIRGEAKLFFDGSIIAKNGTPLLSDPVIQATAGSKWLADLLEESTGRSFSVQPVVLFPGWYIDKSPAGKRSPVWVLNPKAFPKFIEKSSVSLTKEEVAMCSFHLDRYVRSK